MTRLEDDLRATLRAHAPDPEGLDAPRWPSQARRGHGWVRWAAPLAAAVVVVAVVLGGISLLDRGTTSAPPVNPAPTPTVTTPRGVPDGMRAVSYRGVEVLIPDDLVVQQPTCGGSPELEGDRWVSTVVVGAEGEEGVVAGCAGSSEVPSDAGVVRIRPAERSTSTTGASWAEAAPYPVDLAGGPAFTDCATCADGRFESGSSLYFPQQQVVVSAEWFGTKADAFARSVLSSARVVDVDANGCATRRTEPPPPPTQPTMADIAISVDSGSLCTYLGGVSQGSVELSSEQGTELFEELWSGKAFVDRSGRMCGMNPDPAFDLALVRLESGGETIEHVVVRDGCNEYALIDGVLIDDYATTSINGKDIDLIRELRGS